MNGCWIAKISVDLGCGWNHNLSFSIRNGIDRIFWAKPKGLWSFRSMICIRFRTFVIQLFPSRMEWTGKTVWSRKTSTETDGQMVMWTKSSCSIGHISKKFNGLSLSFEYTTLKRCMKIISNHIQEDISMARTWRRYLNRGPLYQFEINTEKAELKHWIFEITVLRSAENHQ